MGSLPISRKRDIRTIGFQDLAQIDKRRRRKNSHSVFPFPLGVCCWIWFIAASVSGWKPRRSILGSRKHFLLVRKQRSMPFGFNVRAGASTSLNTTNAETVSTIRHTLHSQLNDESKDSSEVHVLQQQSSQIQKQENKQKIERERDITHVRAQNQEQRQQSPESFPRKGNGSLPPQSQETEQIPEPEDPRTMHLIRILFLSYYASLGTLMPYLPVYYHSLGHGGQIVGMLGAVKPLTTFVVAPFWGLVADQAQGPFFILKITFAVSLVGQLLVAFRNDHRYIMFMVFLTALFNAPVKSLIDGIVMDHIKDRSQYGRLRLWGQMGFGLGSSAVGVLLNKSKGIDIRTTTSIPESWLDSIAKLPQGMQKSIHFTDKFWQGITGYRLLFLTHAALSVPTWIAIRAFQQLDNEIKDADKVILKKNKKEEHKEVTGGARIMDGLGLLLQNADALIFFGLIFVVGVSSGIIENFAYVRIREVGGTGQDMGLSRLVSSLAGAPMFWFSGPLTEMLGADRVLVMSLLSYVVRFGIYALMRHPLHGLPAEALRGVTFAAFWSTGTVYAHRISPPGLHATMLMFLNAMYGGLGQSLGAIIGGKLQSKFGTVQTFVYSAIVDLFVVAFVFAYLSLRRESNFRSPSPIARRTAT